jgi:uncharacterized protein YodC (DUF2158 family)
MIAKFRVGQQAQIKQGGDLVTIHGAIIPDYGDMLNCKEKVCYAVTYSDGSRSEIDSFDEDELEAIGEKPDMSLVMQEQIQRKVLAIHSLNSISYTEGTKVIILEGKEVSLLATREDSTKIEQTQLIYRIIDFSEDTANYLYNHPCKVMGFGMVLVTAKYGWDSHIVLVNDDLADTLSHYDDSPF